MRQCVPAGRSAGERRQSSTASPPQSLEVFVSGSVIVAGARTPMGRLLGSLKGFSGAQLGGVAIKAALERAGVAPDAVDYVIMGQVLTAGAGQIPARQAAAAAGIPMDVPALTINKVCLSGIDAIALADQLIRAGEYDVVVAGGQESMTQAPHLLAKSREGFKFGDVTMQDHMSYDGLFCAFDQVAMGASTEKYNARYELSRADQDEFAARSHQRAAKATMDGVFAEEIAPVEIPQRKGDPVLFSTDEGIRAETTTESLAKLRPAFSSDGTITAGSASQISDGAAAVVVMSKAKAEELGLTWLAEIGAHGVVAGPDASLHEQPANAIAKACAKEGIDPADLDLVEINEAFAAVGVVSARKLGISDDKVNVNGGAIALGHPIGMSGARIALHLALELRRRGGGVGAAALCGGGGQGDALIVRVPAAS
ncbi:3-ketoacyl-CoA thiolase [Pseudonocardia sp. N23]|nr:3-ketoacyl-CoA thiolase [Pseudonocardia sp. N23]